MSLFASLTSASNALSVFENALTVTQNNVANASTAGYADQTSTFEANQFDTGTGEVGGVSTGPLQSARNQFAEENVRSNTTQLGYYQEQVQSLTPLNNQFDVSGKTGIPAALTSLYGAFSNWANSPNDAAARQNVLTQASSVASAFQTASANVAQLAKTDGQETTSLVDQVNQLAAQLAGFNTQIASTGQDDPGTDAAVNSTLEKLSQVANIVTIRQPNGTFNVSLGGQTELVDGATVNKLTAAVYIPTNSSASSGAALTLPLNIQSGINDTLNLHVDGNAVPSITLNPADKTASDVTSDINTQFQAAGVNATALVDSTGRLVLASGSNTAASSVVIDAGNANAALGLSVGGPPNVRLTDSYGNDVTGQVTGGSLAAAIQQQNQVLPSIQGDFSQTGSLNEMAKGFADRVNSLLGVPLFTYDQTNSTNIAASLQTNPNVTPSQLPSPQVVSLTGTAPSTTPFTITAGSNDTLNLKLDGGTTQTITLSPSDTTLNSVVTDLNTQFSAMGIGAQASIDSGTGGLQIATANTGPTGSIQLLSGTANATLGLSSPTATYSDQSNSIALQLASMSSPSDPANEIGGQSYTAFFAGIASNVGARLSSAQTNQSSQQDVVTQAQSLRQQISGVDLNQEATKVLELQSSYQAASKMISVIDSLTQSVLAIIPQSG